MFSSQSPSSKKHFWDNKILKWEEKSYLKKRSRQHFQSSLIERQKQSLDIPAPYLENKVVYELACGSGRFAKDLLKYDIKAYNGYDFSKAAISKAQQDFQQHPKVNFYCSDINQLEDFQDADIVISLGLLDWLTPAEIKILGQKTIGLPCLHSFSEKKISLKRYLHRLYVLQYGLFNSLYIPRYYKRAELSSSLQIPPSSNIEFYTNKTLGFSCLLTNLTHHDRTVL